MIITELMAISWGAPAYSQEIVTLGERIKISEDRMKFYEEEFVSVCGNGTVEGYVSPKNCAHSRNDGGKLKTPLKSILEDVRSYQKDIQAAALKFGVDPRAIGAVVIAEHSLNMGTLDEFKDLVTAYSPVHSDWSLGWPQMQKVPSEYAEALLAASQNRRTRSLKEVRRDLVNPKTAIPLIAAYLKVITNEYESAAYKALKSKQNMPLVAIESRPEIIGTLFNIGRAAELGKKAGERINSGDQTGARPNNFGLFIKMFLPEITAATGSELSPQHIALPSITPEQRAEAIRFRKLVDQKKFDCPPANAFGDIERFGEELFKTISSVKQ